MKKIVFLIFLLFFVSSISAQKDSLQLGDRYAEDQIYASISYAQFFKQPKEISKSGFSYALSLGFIKDIILNKKGNISFALGVGYGFDFLALVTRTKLSVSSVRVQKFCATTQFNADKVILNFKAPFTLEEGLNHTLDHEFINPKEDDILFYTE